MATEAFSSERVTYVQASFESEIKITDCKVEKAVFSDAKTIMHVVNRAFQKDFFKQDLVGGKLSSTPIVPRISEQGIVEEEMKNKKHTWYIVTTPNRKIIGAVRFTLNSTFVCSLNMLAKDSNLKGVGSLLIEEGVQRARSEGIQNIKVEVVEQNERLIEFYKREKFVPTGKKMPFDFKPAMHSAYWNVIVMCIEMIRKVGNQIESAASPATAAATIAHAAAIK